jgi:hypothetical protein
MPSQSIIDSLRLRDVEDLLELDDQLPILLADLTRTDEGEEKEKEEVGEIVNKVEEEEDEER